MAPVHRWEMHPRLVGNWPFCFSSEALQRVLSREPVCSLQSGWAEVTPVGRQMVGLGNCFVVICVHVPSHPQFIHIPTSTFAFWAYYPTSTRPGRGIELQCSYKASENQWSDREKKPKFILHKDTHGGSKHHSFLLCQSAGLYPSPSMSAHA